jgi:hypothetical protein
LSSGVGRNTSSGSTFNDLMINYMSKGHADYSSMYEGVFFTLILGMADTIRM